MRDEKSVGEAIVSGPRCPICHSTRLRLFLRGNRIAEMGPFLVTTNDFGNFDDLHRCNDCGYVMEFLKPEDLHRAYADSIDNEYMKEEGGRTKTANRIFDMIERHVSPGRLLDVGCYTGVFLAAARARGWQVQGVELSTWAVETARAHYQLEVAQGTLGAVHFPPAQFDLITLIDVIEHLSDPCAVLREAHRLLAPGGYVYVSTPNVDSQFARVMGRRWWSYRLEHVGLFGTGTLERSLRECGFEIVERAVRGRDFTLGYWTGKGSVRNRFGRAIARLLRRTGLQEQMVYLNFFDQIDILARKVESLGSTVLPLTRNTYVSE